MEREGPAVETLTRRLQDCPAAFLEAPVTGKGGVVSVPAVVADLVRDLAGDRLLRPDVFSIAAWTSPKSRNRLRLILVTAWLLYDPWFQTQDDFAEPVRLLLCDELVPLARLIEADAFVTDPDRREELVRYCLHRLGLRPQGETQAQARDRLASLDSVERARVVHETQAAQERARQIREALRRKREQELAAAKPMRE